MRCAVGTGRPKKLETAESDQYGIPENHSDEQLAEHGRLPDADHQVCADLGRQQYDGDAQQQRRDRIGVAGRFFNGRCRNSRRR
jgi:hypothetical protein